MGIKDVEHDREENHCGVVYGHGKQRGVIFCLGERGDGGFKLGGGTREMGFLLVCFAQ